MKVWWLHTYTWYGWRVFNIVVWNSTSWNTTSLNSRALTSWGVVGSEPCVALLAVGDVRLQLGLAFRDCSPPRSHKIPKRIHQESAERPRASHTDVKPQKIMQFDRSGHGVLRTWGATVPEACPEQVSSGHALRQVRSLRVRRRRVHRLNISESKFLGNPPWTYAYQESDWVEAPKFQIISLRIGRNPFTAPTPESCSELCDDVTPTTASRTDYSTSSSIGQGNCSSTLHAIVLRPICHQPIRNRLYLISQLITREGIVAHGVLSGFTPVPFTSKVLNVSAHQPTRTSMSRCLSAQMCGINKSARLQLDQILTLPSDPPSPCITSTSRCVSSWTRSSRYPQTPPPLRSVTNSAARQWARCPRSRR